MLSVIGAVLGAVVKGLLAFFLPSKDEKLGALEVTAAAQKQELKNVQVKNRIDNIVESGSPADIKRMSTDLDAADK